MSTPKKIKVTFNGNADGTRTRGLQLSVGGTDYYLPLGEATPVPPTVADRLRTLTDLYDLKVPAAPTGGGNAGGNSND